MLYPVYVGVRFYFFFSSRRRHTRFDCDWSSDVCSSDLADRGELAPRSALQGLGSATGGQRKPVEQDRKSTRLNSSHSQISYAVFCLKKKTTHDPSRPLEQPHLRLSYVVRHKHIWAR